MILKRSIDRYLDLILIAIGVPMSIGFFMIPLFWSPLAIGLLLTALGSLDLLFNSHSRDKLLHGIGLDDKDAQKLRS